jgi:mannose/fructose/N-acetylgalactosamine-specific phosphotransferase system component IID
MYLVAIAWIYVVLMMALAEALSSQGTVLGALVTFVLYGVLPLGLVLYLLGTPMRRRARHAAEGAAGAAAAEAADSTATLGVASVTAAPDGSGQAAGDAIAAERKEA